MKFAALLRQTADELPEISTLFDLYKQLKKQLKKLPDVAGVTAAEGNVAQQQALTHDEAQFVATIDRSLANLNNMFMDKEEEAVIRLEALQGQSRGAVADDHRRTLYKQLVDFHGEVLLLVHWSVLAYTATVKILKKHHKRTGLLLRAPQLENLLSQPFCSTELMTQLAHKAEECVHELASALACSATSDVVDGACLSGAAGVADTAVGPVAAGLGAAGRVSAPTRLSGAAAQSSDVPSRSGTNHKKATAELPLASASLLPVGGRPGSTPSVHTHAPHDVDRMQRAAVVVDRLARADSAPEAEDGVAAAPAPPAVGSALPPVDKSHHHRHHHHHQATNKPQQSAAMVNGQQQQEAVMRDSVTTSASGGVSHESHDTDEDGSGDEASLQALNGLVAAQRLWQENRKRLGATAASLTSTGEDSGTGAPRHSSGTGSGDASGVGGVAVEVQAGGGGAGGAPQPRRKPTGAMGLLRRTQVALDTWSQLRATASTPSTVLPHDAPGSDGCRSQSLCRSQHPTPTVTHTGVAMACDGAGAVDQAAVTLSKVAATVTGNSCGSGGAEQVGEKRGRATFEQGEQLERE